jgi:hypothetical protein
LQKETSEFVRPAPADPDGVGGNVFFAGVVVYNAAAELESVLGLRLMFKIADGSVYQAR